MPRKKKAIDSKFDCFGILWDDTALECKRCIVREGCAACFGKRSGKQVGEMSEEDMRGLTLCFGRVFKLQSKNCKACMLSQKCRIVFERK